MDGQAVPSRLDSVLTASGRLDDPVRVVRLDQVSDHTVHALAAPTDHILVGFIPDVPDHPVLPELATALDVTYAGPGNLHSSTSIVTVDDPEATCRRMVDAIRTHSGASQILRGVLRANADLPIRAALDVESFAYSTLQGGDEFEKWLDTRRARRRPPPAREPVIVTRTGDELSIVLNRPDRRNAYGTELRDTLCAALDIAIADPTITSVAVSGAGPAFCSGGDLDEFGTTTDTAVAHTIRTVAGAGRRVAELADRVSVRVHGACVGAGIEIPAFASTVIADPKTRFRLPEVSMGLIPGAGGTVSIPRRIGRWRTFHLAVTGEELGADTALEWGLVDRIEPVSPPRV